MEIEPGIRRLCIAMEARGPGVLLQACRSTAPARLHVDFDAAGGIEMAVAPPGVDEMALVTELVTELYRRLAVEPAPMRALLTVFHVGITRIVGEGFGGRGIARARALLRNPALRSAIEDGTAAPGRPCLAVAISAGFFDDLRAEGLPTAGWRPVGAAAAWLCLFGPLGASGPD